MEIRWSPKAADSLESIFDYISRENPGAAQRVAQSIYDGVTRLASFPGSGKRGRMEGTREMGLPPLPYVIVYRVLEHAGVVEIANVIHGAQRWPPDE